MRRALLLLSLLAIQTPCLHAEPLTAGPEVSEKGAYRVTLSCQFIPPVLNRFQDGTLHVAPIRAGTAIPDGIAVAARVPGLGRLMPTSPRARGPLENGNYRIEGLKFDMAGRWRLRLDIGAGASHDRVDFEIDVK